MFPVQYNDAVQQVVQMNGSPYFNQLGYVNNDLVSQYGSEYNSPIELRPQGDIQVVLQYIKEKYELYVTMFNAHEFNTFLPPQDTTISINVLLLIYLWVFLALLLRIKKSGIIPDAILAVDAQIEEVLYTLPSIQSLISIILPSASLIASVDNNTFLSMISIHHGFMYRPDAPPTPIVPSTTPPPYIDHMINQMIVELSIKFTELATARKMKMAQLRLERNILGQAMVTPNHPIKRKIFDQSDISISKRFITKEIVDRAMTTSRDFSIWTKEFLDTWKYEYMYNKNGIPYLRGFHEFDKNILIDDSDDSEFSYRTEEDELSIRSEFDGYDDHQTSMNVYLDARDFNI